MKHRLSLTIISKMDGFRKQLLFIKKLYNQIQAINVKYKDLEMITLTPKIMIGIYMDGII